jgi:hypothetical protein
MREVLMAAIVIGLPSLVVLTMVVLRHRERLARLNAAQGNPALLDSRLSRMEVAIESMAVEIERVSEGQRFVTKLLSERAPSAPRLGGS